MTRTKNIILAEVESSKIEIESMLKEYATYSYDFHSGFEYTDFGQTDSELTEEMIMADKQLTDEDKQQALYFMSLPNTWEKIHEKYCGALKQLYDKVTALEEEIHLIDYCEKMDIMVNSLK